MILEINNAHASINGRKLFEGLSFTSFPGDIVGIYGAHATGKSFILETILGLHSLDKGWITIDGEPVLVSTAAYYRRFMSYLPQGLGFGSSTLDEIAKSMFRAKSSSCNAYTYADICKNLEILGINSENVGRPFCSLDSSSAQRAALALVGMLKHPIVLLDEPTSSQDDAYRSMVTEFLRDKRFATSSIVLTTRDERLLSICDKVITLSK